MISTKKKTPLLLLRDDSVFETRLEGPFGREQDAAASNSRKETKIDPEEEEAGGKNRHQLFLLLESAKMTYGCDFRR